MPLRVLPSGVDTLRLSVCGEVWEAVEAAKQRAQTPVPLDFPLTAQAFLGILVLADVAEDDGDRAGVSRH